MEDLKQLIYDNAYREFKAIKELSDKIDIIESILKEFYNICNHLFNEVHKND